jgi:hypothetical protein
MRVRRFVRWLALFSFFSCTLSAQETNPADSLPTFHSKVQVVLVDVVVRATKTNQYPA